MLIFRETEFFYGSPRTELMFYIQVDSITIVTNTCVKCSQGLSPLCSPRRPWRQTSNPNSSATSSAAQDRWSLSARSAPPLGDGNCSSSYCTEMLGGICITRDHRVRSVPATRGADHARGRGRAGKISVPTNQQHRL
uniref:Uncharacterized protein n=1 Tax=Pipistrellus kuhlii TaxID=59472 RepID=A0A7J7WD10_PIPKU|nr:hypothetical protein mPipKuh1_007998 [Pipistrellus kuhlii]